MDIGALVIDALAPVKGARLLDIGCGRGGLVQRLASAGAVATGVDPAAPPPFAEGLDIHAAGAEKLPFSDAAFDGAVFLNSLHHVPVPLMEDALSEARRVVRPGGRIVVVEPLAEGTFFEVLRPIEDETEVRRAAQNAISAAVSGGRFKLVSRTDVVREDCFPSIAPFLQKVIDADDSRRGFIAENRVTLEDLFQRTATVTPDGAYLLEQPIRIIVLS